MQELLVATRNPGKFREIMEVFCGADGFEGLAFECIFLGDLNMDANDFVEDGKTFAENACKKARYFAEKTGMMALAEDSGLMVEALEGELGVQTRRWGAGEEASDEEWINYFMERMGREGNREARFVCSACLVGDDLEEYFEGETSGVITKKLMAPILTGLPLSSCFLPEGCDKVYAALGTEEKNKISHRGKAIKAVREFLEGTG
jgi:XTP/dITP diphosphohydrolase